jgi:repressor LexA
LHPAQKKLLDLLKENVDAPLTLRELQEQLNLSSHSVVYHHIQQLEKKGLLRRNPSNPKDYQVVSDSPEKSITYLNLYGMAKCGPNGTLLDGDPIDRIPMPSRMLGMASQDAFLVKAKGDSMEPKISNGDFVIAAKNVVPKSGDIVVCSHNAMAKIKKLMFSDSPQSMFLVSLNANYPPEMVSEDELVVEGVVKGVYSYSF